MTLKVGITVGILIRRLFASVRHRLQEENWKNHIDDDVCKDLHTSCTD